MILYAEFGHHQIKDICRCSVYKIVKQEAVLIYHIVCICLLDRVAYALYLRLEHKLVREDVDQLAVSQINHLPVLRKILSVSRPSESMSLGLRWLSVM